MLDFQDLPGKDSKRQIFFTNGITNSWQTWFKPKNANLVHIVCVGGGGGGGAGWSSTSNSGTGGGGGGSSSITTGIFQASLLPDNLYIQIGTGGTRGVSNGQAGGGGALTYVSVIPSQTAINVLLMSGNVGPGGGGGGAGSVQGSTGVAGTAFQQATRPFSYLGIVGSSNGQLGGIGGSVTPGNGGSITIAAPTTGGAGGGGLNLSGTGANGGAITGAGFIPTQPGLTTQVSTYLKGTPGFRILPSENSTQMLPMFFTGGVGGGAGTSSSTGFGGDGGEGAFGSGGGGGGACNTSGGQGFGGKGGDGIVIITCY
jgi:hypothetical protein